MAVVATLGFAERSRDGAVPNGRNERKGRIVERRLRAGAVVWTAIGMVSGCGVDGWIDGLSERSTQVDVFVGHTATAIDGVYPDLGEEDEFRTFPNDLGWMITLVDGFVVTREATIESCDGARRSVDFWRGPVVESLLGSDSDLLTAGNAELEPGEYCKLHVVYGPYEVEQDADRRTIDVDIEGRTLMMASEAALGDDMIPVDFELRERVEVTLDLSSIDDGQPLTIRGDEHFPLEVSLWKTYDRFFDGIDFGRSDSPGDAVSRGAAATLQGETRVNLGMMPPSP